MRVVAAIFRRTSVLCKLGPETLLCLGNPFQGRHRDFELAIATRAGCNGGNHAQPLRYPKITFCHANSFPQVDA
jgi:hypothetical protein